MALLDFIINALTVGGDAAVWLLLLSMIAGLSLNVFWLLRERKRLLDRIFKLEDKVELITIRYGESEKSTAQAINALRDVLIELKTIIEWRRNGKNE